MSRKRRKVIKEDVLLIALNKMFQSCNIEASLEQQKRLLYYFVATMSKYMAEHADYMVQIGKNIYLEKGTCQTRELFRLSIPQAVYNHKKKYEINNAEDLYRYYTGGFYEADRIREVVDQFLENMLDYADKDEELCKEQVTKLKALKQEKEI